ncbi:MAG: hypothetical protein HY526_09090 [Betaproteobacteria bacterium]|nr:hypothetical protein [Betaproteobacteria bacterium]
MKRLAVAAPFAAVLALLFAVPVLSQTQSGKPAAGGAAPEQREMAQGSATRKRSRIYQDARECLKFTANLDVIKCAEKYR